MDGGVLLDSADQIRNTTKDATIQPVRGDTAEEALDHIEPGGGGWREMNMATGPQKVLVHCRVVSLTF